jgi:predicted secreted Zn-dependent protease
MKEELVESSSRRLRLGPVALTALLVASILVAAQGIAQADAAYHTERLELASVGGESGSGQVVNIHPNGPVVGAQERYQLKKAMPESSYEVWLVVGGADFMVTSTIETDARGNGHARARFSAEELAPFSGAVLPVKWELRLDGVVAYETATTIVTID